MTLIVFMMGLIVLPCVNKHLHTEAILHHEKTHPQLKYEEYLSRFGEDLVLFWLGEEPEKIFQLRHKKDLSQFGEGYGFRFWLGEAEKIHYSSGTKKSQFDEDLVQDLE